MSKPKYIPIPSNKKIAKFLGIEIFLREYVGTLLTIKMETINIKTALYKPVFFIKYKSLKFKIRGSKTTPAAAGDGTPSKKFTFQS